MTDASTSFHASLEEMRTAAYELWQRARTEEIAAFELHRGENRDQRPAWQASKDIARNTACAFEQLDRACKAAANVTAGAKP